MSVLFMGSGPFGLQTLRRMSALCSDVQVCTVPDAPSGRKGKLKPTVIKDLARELGLPCYERSTLKAEHGASLVAESEADCVIVADFRLMLATSFLKAIPKHCYNLHGSLLPRWRGAAPIARAVLAGDQEFGVTLYQMVRSLDAGPLVAAKAWKPGKLLSAGAIEQELAEQAADLLELWLPVLRTGGVPLYEQDPKNVTLAPKLEKSEGWMPWHLEPINLWHHVLGMNPWPRAFCEWLPAGSKATQRIFVDQLQIEADADLLSEPGTIRSFEESGIRVSCGPEGRHSVLLTQLQRAGKKSLSAADFLRGTRFQVGDRLTIPSTGSFQ